MLNLQEFSKASQWKNTKDLIKFLQYWKGHVGGYSQKTWSEHKPENYVRHVITVGNSEVNYWIWNITESETKKREGNSGENFSTFRKLYFETKKEERNSLENSNMFKKLFSQSKQRMRNLSRCKSCCSASWTLQVPSSYVIVLPLYVIWSTVNWLRGLL